MAQSKRKTLIDINIKKLRYNLKLLEETEKTNKTPDLYTKSSAKLNVKDKRNLNVQICCFSVQACPKVMLYYFVLFYIRS